MIYFLATSVLLSASLCANVFKIQRTSIYSFLFIGLLFSLIFGFRDGVLASTDLVGYKEMYENIASNKLNWARIEPGFLTFQLFFISIGVSAENFIIITSFIQMFILAFLIRFKIKTNFIFFLIFISTPYLYNFSANTIRQGLAFLIVLFTCISSRKGDWRWYVGVILATSFHFSALLCFVFISIMQNLIHLKKLSLFILTSSFLIFFLPLNSIIISMLTMLPAFSSLGRSVGYILTLEDVVITGRIFYFISFFLSIILLLNFEKVKMYTCSNYGMNSVSFIRLYTLFYYGVVAYPVFSGIGYLVRFTSYGLALFPMFLYFLLSSFFSRNTVHFICVMYLIVYFFYSRNLFIFN